MFEHKLNVSDDGYHYN